MKPILFTGLLAALLVLGADAALAQVTPPSPPGYALLGGYAPLAVTASSARVALPANTTAYGAVTVVNYGTKDAFVALGNSSVAATTSSIPIRAGKHLTLKIGAATNLAAICGGADTTTLDLYQGNGPVSFGP